MLTIFDAALLNCVPLILKRFGPDGLQLWSVTAEDPVILSVGRGTDRREVRLTLSPLTPRFGRFVPF